MSLTSLCVCVFGVCVCVCVCVCLRFVTVEREGAVEDAGNLLLSLIPLIALFSAVSPLSVYSSHLPSLIFLLLSLSHLLSTVSLSQRAS